MIYIKLNDVNADEVISILDTVSGLSSYSKVVKTFYDLKTIASLSANLITEVSKGEKSNV